MSRNRTLYIDADACPVTREALASQGKNTPFAGLELVGRVRWTLVDGDVVHGN